MQGVYFLVVVSIGFTLRYIGKVGSVMSFLRRVPASMSIAAAGHACM